MLADKAFADREVRLRTGWSGGRLFCRRMDRENDMHKFVKHLIRFLIFAVGCTVVVYPITYLGLMYIVGVDETPAHRFSRIATILVNLALFLSYKWPGGLPLFSEEQLEDRPN